MKTPILILFFNRKESVLHLIYKLSEVKPKYMYLGCDGGRTLEEKEYISEIRELVLKNINWDCEINTNFSEENLGCKFAVHNSVQWFFKNVNEGIVLEDDCIPSNAFFNYIEYALDIYRGDSRIASIGGRKDVLGLPLGLASFSSKFFCWGWASWSDRILGNDIEFGYQKKLPRECLKDLSFYESQHVKGIHNMMINRIVNSWAYSYDLIFRERSQLHIIPPYNYIHNIGIGIGTHTKAGRVTDIESRDSFSKDSICIDSEPKRDAAYMDKYFKSKYSFLKTLLFPYIGFLKLEFKY